MLHTEPPRVIRQVPKASRAPFRAPRGPSAPRRGPPPRPTGGSAREASSAGSLQRGLAPPVAVVTPGGRVEVKTAVHQVYHDETYQYYTPKFAPPGRPRPGAHASAERLSRARGALAAPPSALGGRVARIGLFGPRAQSAPPRPEGSRAAPERPSGPDAVAAAVRWGLWGTSEHPPALGGHVEGRRKGSVLRRSGKSRADYLLFRNSENYRRLDSFLIGE